MVIVVDILDVSVIHVVVIVFIVFDGSFTESIPDGFLLGLLFLLAVGSDTRIRLYICCSGVRVDLFGLCVLLNVLFYLLLILSLVLQLQLGCFGVQGVGRVRVQQQLRQEYFEDVYQVVHRRPCLVDHVQAH